MRAFIAALIPNDVKSRLKSYADELKTKWEGVRWENPDKIHLTLKFLGDVEAGKLDEIEESVKAAVVKYSAIDAQISRLGGFPDLASPRVLFIALSENLKLSGLQREIDSSFASLGFPEEERGFKPHLTIGRVKGVARIKSALPTPPGIEFRIDEIAVMESELRREGSIYTPISTFRLRSARPDETQSPESEFFIMRNREIPP